MRKQQSALPCMLCVYSTNFIIYVVYAILHTCVEMHMLTIRLNWWPIYVHADSCALHISCNLYWTHKAWGAGWTVSLPYAPGTCVIMSE